MTNFARILPVDMAIAMLALTPKDALHHLCSVSSHRTSRQVGIDEVVWSASSLPVRHGLLMAWLAMERAG